MTLALHLQLAGASMILLALAHPYFSRHLGWRADTERMTLLTRQVFWVHCFYVCFTVAAMGAVALFATPALLERTRLGFFAALVVLVFWSTRLGVQFFGYAREHWRGHTLNTLAHIAFSLLWAYYVAVSAALVAHQR